MKKIIIYTLLLVSGTAFAQVPVARFAHPQSVLQQELRQKGQARRIDRTVPTPPVVVNEEVDPAQVANVHPQLLAEGQRMPQAEANAASYANPVGTFFLGVDEAGKGSWFSLNGVIGAWSDSIPCWRWPNTTTGAYASVKYETALSTQYPSYVEDALYGVDADGSFTDSIVSSGGWNEAYAMGANGDEGYLWQMAVPLQTVKRNNGDTETFQLLKRTRDYSGSNCPYAAGGLPSGATTDGLWPLTQAEPIQSNGVSMDLIAGRDGDGYVHYLFGSSKLTTDSVVGEGEEPTTYTRVAPTKLTVFYDHLQAPLFVKSITLALGADGYSVAHKERLVVNNLHLEIQDKAGNVIAESEATAANKSNLTYSGHLGQMLTFKFREESDYGELLHEGLLLKESFQLVITGFQEEDAFGIYAAKSNIHASQAIMEYEDGTHYGIDYEPYIMLNGIFTTWENYLDIAAYEEEGLITDVHGDTIDINFVTASSPFYKYMAHYAGEDLKGVAYFAFYSTFTPYDSVSLMWNLDIEMPEYISLGADYTYNVADDDDPITLWDYLRIFEMWVYATETPQIGDCIKIGKAGRYAVLRVTQIDGATALPGVKADNAVKAQKVLYNGSLYILKDGKRYSVLGQ